MSSVDGLFCVNVRRMLLWYHPAKYSSTTSFCGRCVRELFVLLAEVVGGCVDQQQDRFLNGPTRSA